MSSLTTAEVRTLAEAPALAVDGGSRSGLVRLIHDLASALLESRSDTTEACQDLAKMTLKWMDAATEVESLRSDIRAMVAKAAERSLDGYRELGARAAAAENQRDKARAALLEARELLDDEGTRTHGAMAALAREGHTEHCAARLAWGDGECECGGSL